MSIRAAMAPMGPVHVRLTGLVRGDDKGPGIGIVNAPTAAEATAELHRVARVAGADRVVSVAADYRRAALAGGTTSTQWRIEVQAWGTAMAPAKVEPSEPPEEQRAQDADKAKDRAKDQDAAKQTQDARTDARDPAEQVASRETATSEQAAASRVEAAPQAAAPVLGIESATVTTGDSTPLPSAAAPAPR